MNVSRKFGAAVAEEMKTMPKIVQVGTSVSKRSLETNHEIVQESWGIHTSVAYNKVELTTQLDVIILRPHPSLMMCMRTNYRMLR